MDTLFALRLPQPSAEAARREEQCRALVEAANVPVAEVQAAVDVVHCYTVRAEVAPAKV